MLMLIAMCSHLFLIALSISFHQYPKKSFLHICSCTRGSTLTTSTSRGEEEARGEPTAPALEAKVTFILSTGLAFIKSAFSGKIMPHVLILIFMFSEEPLTPPHTPSEEDRLRLRGGLTLLEPPASISETGVNPEFLGVAGGVAPIR